MSELRDLLNLKRDNQALSAAQYQVLANAIARDEVSPARLGALAMAIYQAGMPAAECADLTCAMAASGWQADWSGFDLDGPLLDKHSTGGLGDIVSFLLAPMVAACGGYVPMISGRSLEHTGGTVDKLEAIPGYNPFPDPAQFQQIVADCGLAIVGQTANLVPADQRLYATRDETATVASLPLIAASILSKKKAEGLDALVLDLKTGSGAFMQTQEEAEPLGSYMQAVAKACDINCAVLYTDMNQPLANCIGDGVEMREVVRYLTGQRRSTRLHDVTMELATQLLVRSDMEKTAETARERLDEVLESGLAAERFARMVTTLGGPSDFLENTDQHLGQAAVIKPLPTARDGVVATIDGRRLGHAVHQVGRREGQTAFDPRVGFAEIVELGTTIAAGDPLLQIHARSQAEYETLAAAARQALVVENQN